MTTAWNIEYILIFYLKQKYVGVIITDDQKDECDTRHQVKSVYSSENAIVQKFKHSIVEVKVKLCKSYCNSSIVHTSGLLENSYLLII